MQKSWFSALDSPLPGLNMIITDNDIGENANYKLSLRGIQNVGDSFTVYPDSGSGHTAVVVRVSDTKNLDYDIEDEDLRILIFEVVAGVPNEYVSKKVPPMFRFVQFLCNLQTHITSRLTIFVYFIQNVVREVAKSRVIVHLQDANDNAPKFSNQSYHLSIPENIPPNSMVFPVSATDKDSGFYGMIKYYLKGFGAHKFRTDFRRGGIYTASTTLGK